MSAKGNAYDNAVIESFFGTLKCENYLQRLKSLADLIRTIDEYIYWFIIMTRIKLTLGGYSLQPNIDS